MQLETDFIRQNEIQSALIYVERLKRDPVSSYLRQTTQTGSSQLLSTQFEPFYAQTFQKVSRTQIKHK